MHVQCFTFGPFATNTYVVSDEKGYALLIDPACSAPYERTELLAYLQPFRVQAIVATHGHLDHLWGAAWACEQWSLPVLIHRADIPMTEAMQAQYDLFGIRSTPKPFPTESIQCKERYEGGLLLEMEVIETPGHTPGSVCLYWPKEGVLLSGDTLFHMGYGRTDLPGGDIGQLIRSLEKLFALPGETRVYPGHGDCTTIQRESRAIQ